MIALYDSDFSRELSDELKAEGIRLVPIYTQNAHGRAVYLPGPMKLLRNFPFCRILFSILRFYLLFACFLHSGCYNMKLRSASGQD